MTDNFKSDYLMEADEYIPDEKKSQIPNDEDMPENSKSDDEFGVDMYNGDEMLPVEPAGDGMAVDYGDDMEADETSDDSEAGVSDISEIFSIVSEFFPDEDEHKVKDWIESTMETENISTEAEFLDLFDDAESMETSYKSFGGDEDAVEAEEDSEKDEDSDEEEKEPVTESRKKFSRKKRLNEGGGAGVNFDFTECAIDTKTKKVTGNLKLSSYQEYQEFDENYGYADVGRIAQNDQEILRLIRAESGGDGVTRIVDLSFTKSSKYMFGGGYVRKPLVPGTKIPVEVMVDVEGGEDDYYYLELDVELSQEVSYMYSDLDEIGEEPVTESRKKPKLSESDESSYIEWLDDNAPTDEDKWIIGGQLRSQYMNSGKYGQALKKFDPIAFRTGFNDYKRDVLKEAYSEDLSKELQLFMTIKTSTQSDFVKKLAAESIEKIRAELKKPAEQPKTPVTESVRDRIRAKLRANRK